MSRRPGTTAAEQRAAQRRIDLELQQAHAEGDEPFHPTIPHHRIRRQRLDDPPVAEVRVQLATQVGAQARGGRNVPATRANAAVGGQAGTHREGPQVPVAAARRRIIVESSSSSDDDDDSNYQPSDRNDVRYRLADYSAESPLTPGDEANRSLVDRPFPRGQANNNAVNDMAAAEALLFSDASEDGLRDTSSDDESAHVTAGVAPAMHYHRGIAADVAHNAFQNRGIAADVARHPSSMHDIALHPPEAQAVDLDWDDLDWALKKLIPFSSRQVNTFKEYIVDSLEDFHHVTEEQLRKSCSAMAKEAGDRMKMSLVQVNRLIGLMHWVQDHKRVDAVMTPSSTGSTI